MQIKAAEIADIIRRQIEGHETTIDMSEVGTVISVGDGIARVYGLDGVMAGELLELPHDVYGLALNLEDDNVGCVLMGEVHLVSEGDEVKRTRRILDIPVGEGLSVAWSIPSAARRTARARWNPPSGTPWSASPPAWSTASR
jgi:F-type H+-transporting ATPase subunit alpha